jgi:glycosyltransferase involved in cell wall biosynthesis
MKILTINNAADVSGSSRCMERVFGHFAQSSHEVHAVLPESGPLVPMLEACGVHVHIHRGLTLMEPAQLKSIRGLLRFLFGLPLSVFFLARLIRSQQIDIVHTNSGITPSPSIAAFITGTPHVWQIRDFFLDLGKLGALYQRWIYHLSSSIVAVSSCVRDQFSSQFHDKIQVVYDGLDTSAITPDPYRVAAFRARFPPEAQIIGVAASSESHRKDYEILVRAASLLRTRFPYARYVLFEASSTRQNQQAPLQDLISISGLDDIVKFIDDVPADASAFAALDITVAPSIHPEPFNFAVIESMAAGTPVVGSCTGCIAEQIIPYETGLLFAPGSSEQLFRDLSLLLNNPSLRTRFAEAGKHRAHMHFSLEATCTAMVRLFDQLLYPESKRGRSRAAASSRV